MKKYIVIITIFLLAGFISSCDSSDTGNDNIARDFRLSSIDENAEYSLSDFSEQPVVLNFWASWCAPCKEELPLLEKAWDMYKDKNIRFIGINIMDNRESAELLLKKYGVSYINLFDKDGKVSQMYGVSALPVTVFIDSNGDIVRKKYGPFLGDEGEKTFMSYLRELSQ